MAAAAARSQAPPTPPGLGEDAGPHPVVRAVVGLLLGVALGLLAALLSPRRPPAAAAGEVPHGASDGGAGGRATEAEDAPA